MCYIVPPGSVHTVFLAPQSALVPVTLPWSSPDTLPGTSSHAQYWNRESVMFALNQHLQNTNYTYNLHDAKLKELINLTVHSMGRIRDHPVV